MDKSVIKNGDLVDYKRAIKMFIIYNICSIFRCIEHIFSFLLPIKTNRVTFILNRKSEIACNIKYLINDIKEKFGNQVDIRLITLDNKDYKDNNGFKVYKINSIKACFIQFTSKVVVTNDAFQELPYKRKKQYFINVWHGAMNYKHIGTNYLTYVSKCDKKRFIRRNVQPDLFVAGSEYFLNDTASSFNFDKKIFINSGLPRNDIFFKDTSSLQKAIKERLNIKETDKVLIYAPTFRRTKKKSKYDLDTDRLTRNLSNKFGGNWVILYRSHYFVDEKNELVDKNIIDVSKYPDINELLIISDALITDYSSCMWDFSLGDNIKPVFIYAPDLDFYKNGDRTLSYNLENGPYPIAINKDMLETNISNFDNDKYIENVKNHLKECNSFDDGNATTRISNIIMSELKLK